MQAITGVAVALQLSTRPTPRQSSVTMAREVPHFLCQGKKVRAERITGVPCSNPIRYDQYVVRGIKYCRYHLDQADPVVKQSPPPSPPPEHVPQRPRYGLRPRPKADPPLQPPRRKHHHLHEHRVHFDDHTLRILDERDSRLVTEPAPSYRKTRHRKPAQPAVSDTVDQPTVPHHATHPHPHAPVFHEGDECPSTSPSLEELYREFIQMPAVQPKPAHPTVPTQRRRGGEAIRPRLPVLKEKDNRAAPFHRTNDTIEVTACHQANHSRLPVLKENDNGAPPFHRPNSSIQTPAVQPKPPHPPVPNQPNSRGDVPAPHHAPYPRRPTPQEKDNRFEAYYLLNDLDETDHHASRTAPLPTRPTVTSRRPATHRTEEELEQDHNPTRSSYREPPAPSPAESFYLPNDLDERHHHHARKPLYPPPPIQPTTTSRPPFKEEQDHHNTNTRHHHHARPPIKHEQHYRPPFPSPPPNHRTAHPHDLISLHSSSTSSSPSPSSPPSPLPQIHHTLTPPTTGMPGAFVASPAPVPSSSELGVQVDMKELYARVAEERQQRVREQQFRLQQLEKQRVEDHHFKLQQLKGRQLGKQQRVRDQQQQQQVYDRQLDERRFKEKQQQLKDQLLEKKRLRDQQLYDRQLAERRFNEFQLNEQRLKDHYLREQQLEDQRLKKEPVKDEQRKDILPSENRPEMEEQQTQRPQSGSRPFGFWFPQTPSRLPVQQFPSQIQKSLSQFQMSPSQIQEQLKKQADFAKSFEVRSQTGRLPTPPSPQDPHRQDQEPTPSELKSRRSPLLPATPQTQEHSQKQAHIAKSPKACPGPPPGHLPTPPGSQSPITQPHHQEQGPETSVPSPHLPNAMPSPPNLPSAHCCLALTNRGTQCTRAPLPASGGGEGLCKQHLKKLQRGGQLPRLHLPAATQHGEEEDEANDDKGRGAEGGERVSEPLNATVPPLPHHLNPLTPLRPRTLSPLSSFGPAPRVVHPRNPYASPASRHESPRSRGGSLPASAAAAAAVEVDMSRLYELAGSNDVADAEAEARGLEVEVDMAALERAVAEEEEDRDEDRDEEPYLAARMRAALWEEEAARARRVVRVVEESEVLVGRMEEVVRAEKEEVGEERRRRRRGGARVGADARLVKEGRVDVGEGRRLRSERG